jgi:hypothetical protein
MFIIICDICHVNEGGTLLITIGVINFVVIEGNGF